MLTVEAKTQQASVDVDVRYGVCTITFHGTVGFELAQVAIKEVARIGDRAKVLLVDTRYSLIAVAHTEAWGAYPPLKPMILIIKEMQLGQMAAMRTARARLGLVTELFVHDQVNASRFAQRLALRCLDDEWQDSAYLLAL